MNPFNNEPLTADQLNKDSLCYLSVTKNQVKSSRLFLGYIHDTNVKRLSAHYDVPEDYFKDVKPAEEILTQLLAKSSGDPCFFHDGIQSGFWMIQ